MFYANLKKSIKDSSHKHHIRVFVWGHFFTFNPGIISDFLYHQCMDAVPLKELYYNELTVLLTNNVRTAYLKGQDFKASELTPTYTALHAIATKIGLQLANEMWSLKWWSCFSIRLSYSPHLILGQMIFDEITKHAKMKNESLSLPFSFFNLLDPYATKALGYN